VRWLEEPLDRYDWEGLAKLCEMVEIPIAGGESNLGLHELRWMIERDVYDIIQLECQRQEGMSQVRKIVGLAEMHNKQVVPHSGWEAFGFLAHVHLAAAVPNCPYVELMHEPPAFRRRSSRPSWPSHYCRTPTGTSWCPASGPRRGAPRRPVESRMTLVVKADARTTSIRYYCRGEVSPGLVVCWGRRLRARVGGQAGGQQP